MNIAILILGIVEVIICAVSFLFKKKEYFLFTLLLYNVVLFIQYQIQRCELESLIIAVDIAKNCIFYFFDKCHKKPNIYVILFFEILVVATSIATLNHWSGMFVVFASMIGTFAAWQNNMLLLRILYAVCSILLIINYAFTGLYTTIIAESITLIFAILSIYFNFIKNKDITSNKFDADNFNKEK